MPGPPPLGPIQGLRLALSYVWAFLPTLTIGILAPLPILHAAFKLRTWSLWVGSVVYAAAAIVAFAAVPGGDADTPDWVGGIFLGLMIVPTAQALAVRRKVFAPSADPALVAILHARQRREEAREIAARDPSLARELRIGRPDLSRQFDDGGLVDVNNAPAPVLARHLGLSDADTSRVVEGRDRLGGFSSPEEIIAFTDVPAPVVDDIRDRIVFLR
jgi:hypothetical protein